MNHMTFAWICRSPHEVPGPTICCNYSYTSILQVKSFFSFLHCQKVMQSIFWQEKLSLPLKYDACSILAERVVHFRQISAKMQSFNCSFQRGFAKKKNWYLFRQLGVILANQSILVKNLSKIISDLMRKLAFVQKLKLEPYFRWHCVRLIKICSTNVIIVEFL